MTQSMRCRLALLLFVAGLTDARSLAAQVPNATVTREAFRSLAWLSGKWKGAGGSFAAFYEEYRVLNDSTIEQYEHPDSTFSATRPRSTITWRSGHATKGLGDRIESRITRIAGDTVRFDFARPGGQGFTWLRISPDEWRAILDGRTTPVIYTMRRYTR